MLPLTHNDIEANFKISMGIVPSMKHVSRYGEIPTTDGTEQVIWKLGGAITDTGIFPASEVDCYVTSTSILDISVILKVAYLDIDHAVIEEEITLTGDIGAKLVSKAHRILSAVVLGTIALQGDVYFGTEPTPVGGIPALINTMNFIEQKNQRTTLLHSSVPTGYTLFVYAMSGGTSRKEESVIVGYHTLGDTNNFILGIQVPMIESFSTLKIPYFKVPEKSDIVFVTKSNTGNTDEVTASFNAILVENIILHEGN